MAMLIAPSAADDSSDGSDGKATELASRLLQRLIDLATEGAGPWKGGPEVAEEALRAAAGDREQAIDALVATHKLLVGTSGAVTGLPGGPLVALAIPTDVWTYYLAATRLAVAIAHLRGHDPQDEHVKAVIGATLLGAAGTEILAKAGVVIGNKIAMAQLKRLPGRVLIEINKRVGFRLLTKFGTTGAVNLVKIVPLIGAGVGATVNMVSMSGVGVAAKWAFPLVFGSAEHDTAVN
ncbi:hypothetical protein SAMN06264364_14518 [Quadrisphaera granulorum]|uniref:EcsC family protein n=1 Tax=Quadrisphaera granulorum TaxID=317664 RepID=A0A315ZP21_9ACTN|nr:hypothetical protein [Quadrisphaera granulorum]PWJ46863.1 hypothetical protein BXY45_14518 [Quadrisphaera granulorum]SZE99030.1 hypothetical protein SAMN06264364_14518 [Quadrisphaera granulorum]